MRTRTTTPAERTPTPSVVTEQDESSDEGLSAYEKLRRDNIRRNAAKLKELGLDRPILPPPKATHTKKSKTITAGVEERRKNPPRRSTRKRRKVVYNSDADDDDDDIVNSKEEHDLEYRTEEEEDPEETEEFLPAPRKRRNLSPKTSDPTNERVETPASTIKVGDVITCESAKTSRSTCRKCREKIEKGSPRVGMKAWIMGRQSMTWQRPECFLKNFVFGYEASGRSRCKLTDHNFTKGELKIGTRSHTATSFFKAEAFRDVLQDVLHFWVLSHNNGAQHLEEHVNAKKILCVESIEGHEKLSDGDRRDFLSLLTSVKSSVFSKSRQPTGAGDNVGSALAVKKENVEPEKAVESESGVSVGDTKTQPEVGHKSGAKGKVEWKFGSYLCTGILLPSKETNTHCFAKTHKGNIKTLAKGKAYWSIVG